MPIARGALELIFVRKNAHAPNPYSDASVLDSCRSFIGGGNKKTCSGSAIIAIRHYNNNVFLIAENARDVLTMENVAYSDFMKTLKNTNVPRTFTRGTFAHTRNSAGFTFHSLVTVPSPFLQNTLESIIRQ